MEFSVVMAAVDFLPVILFAVASVIFQRGFYSRMSKGGFAVYCCGTIMIVTAGFYKALWKLLYALEICDFVALNSLFMPLQATGFLLAGAVTVAYVCSKRSKSATLAVVPVFTSSMPFVFAMVLGVMGLNISYAVISVRAKRIRSAIFFIVALIGQMGMGYLSTKDFSGSAMNWAAEILNTFSMILLLLGAMDLHKTALTD